MPGLRDILDAATPGRWEAARSVVISVADPRDGVAVAPTEADAALIALAPELAAVAIAADVPMFRECITEPRCGDCPGCRLDTALSRLGAGDSNQNEKG